METSHWRTAVGFALTFPLLLLAPISQATAADHGDAPLQANDRQGDIGDTFFFLDPNDNTRAVLAMTVQGFITPGEAVNFGFFDQCVRYRFELETTGDAKSDHFIHFAFTDKAPLVWLRLEPEAVLGGPRDSTRFLVDAVTWPGGARRILAWTDGHVRFVESLT